MEEDWMFQVGEEVLDIHNSRGVVLGKAIRPDGYLNRRQYLVGFTKKGIFGQEKKKQEWILEASLTKIVH